MAEIQSSINNMLGSAAIGMGLFAASPQGKRLAEKADLKRQEKGVAKALKSHIESARGITEATPNDIENRFKTQMELGQRLEDIKKRQFEIDPSRKSYDQYLGVRNVNKGMDDKWAAVQKAKLNAQQSMQAAQEQKRSRVPIYGSRGEVING